MGTPCLAPRDDAGVPQQRPAPPFRCVRFGTERPCPPADELFRIVHTLPELRDSDRPGCPGRVGRLENAPAVSSMPRGLSTNLTSLEPRTRTGSRRGRHGLRGRRFPCHVDLYRAARRNHGQLAYEAWRRGWMARARRLRAVLDSPASTRSSASRTRFSVPRRVLRSPEPLDRIGGTRGWSRRPLPTTRTAGSGRLSRAGGAGRPGWVPDLSLAWSSSSGRESTAPSCQGASRLDTSAWR